MINYVSFIKKHQLYSSQIFRESAKYVPNRVKSRKPWEKMDKCPTTLPRNDASAGPSFEVRYDMQNGKNDIFKSDLTLYVGVDPDVC